MKRILSILLIISTIQCTLYGQVRDSRIASIENQLEALKVETDGLEEPININISQTTLSNFLIAIAKVHNLNINVSPELGSIEIVNNFSDVSVDEILLFLVKEYELDIDFTGNILSIGKYVPPPTADVQPKINAEYDLTGQSLSLDLKNNKLDRVFRTIMDLSGKNLLYQPDIENQPLSIYIKDAPFDLALSKLAETNNLVLNKSRDGFYTFESAITTPAGNSNNASKPVRRRSTGFYYQIVDSLNRRVSVDFQNTPIADIVYSISEDLNLDVFTASPLDQAGLASVTANDISFDLLLDKIFESNSAVQNTNTGDAPSVRFTYKKDNNIYYFGTEDQLSLKRVELVPMMHRSVQLLKNPSGGGRRRAGRNNFAVGGTSFVGGVNPINQNQNNRFNNTGTSETTENLASIEDIIPEDVKNGLDIKIDPELNSFIVSGPATGVERFKEFITYIDKPVPVILIEVMILEVNRSAITETGISFGVGDQPVETRGEFFPAGNVNIGARDVNKVIGNFDGFGSLNIGKVVPNFYLDIKAMEASGTLKIRSTPKLATINGHKAYLSSGETTYYAVTNQTFFGSQIPQTSEITNYYPIDAELSLEILPFVSGDGQITLDVQVLQSAFSGERITEEAPPGISSREFSSIVRMQDQDVVVLGGIESIRKDDSGSGVPFLARIPVIKWLFSKRRREATKRNLNILIRPTVID